MCNYTVSKKRLRLTSKDQNLIDVVKEYLELNDITPNIYVRSRSKGYHHWYTLELYSRKAIKAGTILDLRHPKFVYL